jgi:hypothetical protein
MATRVDHSLSANLLTGALLPRVDIAIGHGLKYLAQTLFQRSAPRDQPYPPRGLSPSALPAIDTPHASARTSAPSSLPALRCAETDRLHEQLGSDKINDVSDYHQIISAAADPVDKAKTFSASGQPPASRDDQTANLQDAWLARVTVPDKDGSPVQKNILPDSLMHSSLLNRRLGRLVAESLPAGQTAAQLLGQQRALVDERSRLIEERNALWQRPAEPAVGGETDPATNARLSQINRRIAAIGRELAALEPAIETQRIASGGARGKVQQQFPNTLYDPMTGFCATLSLRNSNEVVIAFSGVGSQRGGLAQGVRGALNALGLAPPKNMAQASQLTRMVKAHLDALNRELPPDQQLKLTLTGFSMGGGLATYAALRNQVPAVAISPMRLGLLARAKCGQAALKNAPQLVTEVTVQSDWVADNSRARGLKLLSLPSYLLTGRKADSLGAIGYRYLMPKPNETERMMLAAEWGWSEQQTEAIGRRIDVHADFPLCLEVHRKRLAKAEAQSTAPSESSRNPSPG